MIKCYDVVIIGAGTSGLSARNEVAKKTNNYLVVDDGALGTTCARIGCMPSKVFIQVANDFHRRNIFNEVGIHGKESLKVDVVHVMKHVRRLRDRFTDGVKASMDVWKEGHFVNKKAKFLSSNRIDIEGTTIEGKNIIIAIGSKPFLPKDWEEYSKFFIDTDDFFESSDFPKKMAVIGLGVLGIELGQALSRLGIDVIAIGSSKSIAGLTDPEIINYTSIMFSEELSTDYTSVKKLKKEGARLRVFTDNKSYLVDKVLLAIGRKASIMDLGLDEIGIKLNDKKMPLFDKHTLRIPDSNIYIAGDCNGDRPLLHEASDEGAIAGFNSVRPKDSTYKRRVFMSITFCSPNICMVGKNYRDLKNSGINFECGEVLFEGQGRSIIMLKEKGLLRVYGNKKNGLIYGAEFCVPSGEHLAHLLAWCIQKEMTVFEILGMPFYHPGIEEGLRTALRKLASKIEDPRPQLEIARCLEHPTSHDINLA